jgi:hypothetical protein
VVEGLKRVEKGVDKTASELAIARLQKDIESLEEKRRWVESQSNNSLYLWGAGLLIFSPVISSGNTGALLIIGGIGVLLLVIAITSSISNSKEKSEIQAQIASIQSEIAKHQRIVKV